MKIKIKVNKIIQFVSLFCGMFCATAIEDIKDLSQKPTSKNCIHQDVLTHWNKCQTKIPPVLLDYFIAHRNHKNFILMNKDINPNFFLDSDFLLTNNRLHDAQTALDNAINKRIFDVSKKTDEILDYSEYLYNCKSEYIKIFNRFLDAEKAADRTKIVRFSEEIESIKFEVPEEAKMRSYKPKKSLENKPKKITIINLKEEFPPSPEALD